jgi:NADH:ubiquinone oxidoreductase subunit C
MQFLENKNLLSSLFISPFSYSFASNEILSSEALFPSIAKLLATSSNISLLEGSAVDFMEGPRRFLLFYVFSTLSFNFSASIPFFLFTKAFGFSPVFSFSSLFPSANWIERETFDMFGIIFNNHPDLRRILTDYGFRGHPLRKDFPLSGFFEIYYSSFVKGIQVRPLHLLQMSRNFSASFAWLKV